MILQLFQTFLVLLWQASPAQTSPKETNCLALQLPEAGNGMTRRVSKKLNFNCWLLTTDVDGLVCSRNVLRLAYFSLAVLTQEHFTTSVVRWSLLTRSLGHFIALESLISCQNGHVIKVIWGHTSEYVVTGSGVGLCPRLWPKGNTATGAKLKRGLHLCSSSAGYGPASWPTYLCIYWCINCPAAQPPSGAQFLSG